MLLYSIRIKGTHSTCMRNCLGKSLAIQSCELIIEHDLCLYHESLQIHQVLFSFFFFAELVLTRNLVFYEQKT